MSTVSLVEFEAISESVKMWGRWGPEDELGTLELHHACDYGQPR